MYSMVKGNTSIDRWKGRDYDNWGVGVVAGGMARCSSSETEMYSCKYGGDRTSVRSREFGNIRSSENQMY